MTNQLFLSAKELTLSEEIQRAVQSKYASLAGSGLSSDHGGVRAVAEAFGATKGDRLLFW